MVARCRADRSNPLLPNPSPGCRSQGSPSRRDRRWRSCEFEVDDVYDIPPGHDATVVGDETFEAIEFASARIFAMPTDGDRVLAAVLCTDIVDSTSHLRRLGDSAWRELLTEHNQQTRGELNPVSRARDPDYRRWLPCCIRRACSGSSMRAGNRFVSRQPRHRYPSRNSHRRGRIKSALTFEALLSTKPHVSRVPRRQAKSSSPRRQNFCWLVRGSRSNPRGSISSRASATPASYSGLPDLGEHRRKCHLVARS